MPVTTLPSQQRTVSATDEQQRLTEEELTLLDAVAQDGVPDFEFEAPRLKAEVRAADLPPL